jgi:hypothetical protein
LPGLLLFSQASSSPLRARAERRPLVRGGCRQIGAVRPSTQ